MLSQTLERRVSAVSHHFALHFLRTLARMLLSVLVSVACSGLAIAFGGPTVKDVIEFTRIAQPQSHDTDALQSQVSPDGARAFIVTRKADVASDKNRFEILLFDVEPGRLAALHAAGRSAVHQRLLTIEATEDTDDTDPFLQDARWVGNRTIVFRGRMPGEQFQVHAVDVVTRRLTQLTFQAEGVVSFDVSRDLKRVLYVAPVPNPPLPAGSRSVVVGNQSFWSVKFGQNDRWAQHRRYQYWVGEGGSRRGARKLGESFPESSGMHPRVNVSPDGRWALLPRYEPGRQLAWGKWYPLVAELTAKVGPALLQDPLSYYTRPYSYIPRRLVAYRLSDGSERTVVDAPDDVYPGSGQMRADQVWREDGTSVVIAGTYLPPKDGEVAPSSVAHVIEYWPESGRWTVIAALKVRASGAYAVANERDTFVVIDDGKRRHFVRQADGGWREDAEDAGASGAPAASSSTSGPVRRGWPLRIEQALNQPPDVVAAGPAGEIVRLTTLNPQFSAATWGTIRPYSWKDAKGRAWDGGLMVPSDYVAGGKHALVIQTYGFSPARFYLDGSNFYDGFTSGFAGRAFLREGVLVLAFPWSASSNAPSGDHAAIGGFMDGVRGAIEALVAEGIVDRDRIGIMGWSGTGERVLNQVTFSDAPIRAATILDGDSNTFLSMVVTYGARDSIQGRKEAANEGTPSGESLQRWIRNDPSLHTQCIKAALRIETYGPMSLNNWDIYAMLRRQYKAAEMIVIPAGSHALSRPSERMISLQGNVDWYRFWLKGEERTGLVLPNETDAALKQQYARWRQMAELKRADDAKPPCVRSAVGG
jgi:dipeptidyl aminopeptidase/acylaminoacyl peptidase